MKKKTNLLLCTLALFTLSLNAIGTEPIKMTSDEAKALFYKTMSTNYNTPLSPSKDTGAQWFPKAGFGLFIHWGIHSVVPINPSWSMIKNCFKQKRPAKVPMEEYYKLAEKFNPQHYDPNKWLAMAKSIGMQYAVLTTKHHDGYAMWPSKYGEYNTQIYMNGRDLVKDYVAACRKYGLKVGFYYSPRDWGYNHHKSNFSAPMCGFDHLAKSEMIFKGDECQKEYLKWVDYTVGQLSELLTQYGRVDVLWFDGGVWKGAKGADVYEKRIRNWIYKLQPGIVINPRWGGAPINPDYKNHKVDSHTKKLARSIGDFLTFEQKFDAIHERSEVLYTKAWFEYCRTWYGHWGYAPAASDKPKIETIQKILCQLAILRAFGGNMLLNVGPSKDGELRPDIYSEAAILAKWMQKNRESLIGTTPVKTWEKHAARPLTENGKNLYLLIPVNCGKFKQKKKKHTPIWNDKEFPNVFTMKDIPKPLNIVHLSSGKKVEFNYDETKKELVIEKAAEKDNLMNVYKLEYSSAPVLP
jgi:alpha-L-fucosidase